jgi:hypothetical protein
MNATEMESTIKTLQAQVKELKARTGIIEDIEQIKKLQRTYGYNIDNPGPGFEFFYLGL